jgi:hypothetical protein
MRAQTVTVGPLAATSANNICTSQTPTGNNQIAINGTTATTSATFTASISGNQLIVTAISSGAIQLGQSVNGLGVPANTTIIGPPPGPGQTAVAGGTGTYILSTSGTVSSTTLYTNTVATLDTPRRVQLTTTNSGDLNKTMTLTGTDWNNSVITEVLVAASASTSYTNLDFKTITSIVSSATYLGAVTVGTNAVASSAWVRLDEYTTFPTAIQVTVNTAMGALQTYTVQQTLQDPNSPTNSILPYQLTWINTSDPNVVGAVSSQQSSYTYAPILARVTMNYNAPTAAVTGAVTAIFIQNASASF